MSNLVPFSPWSVHSTPRLFSNSPVETNVTSTRRVQLRLSVEISLDRSKSSVATTVTLLPLAKKCLNWSSIPLILKSTVRSAHRTTRSSQASSPFNTDRTDKLRSTKTQVKRLALGRHIQHSRQSKPRIKRAHCKALISQTDPFSKSMVHSMLSLTFPSPAAKSASSIPRALYRWWRAIRLAHSSFWRVMSVFMRHLRHR